MGQNSHTVSAGKKHTPKHAFNPTGQRPPQVVKQQKPQLPTDIKSRPTNQHPLHYPGKHGSRTLLSSPTANSTSTQPKKSSPSSGGKKYRHEDKKAPSSSSLSVAPSKRPDKFKLKEEGSLNSKKLINNDSLFNKAMNGDTVSSGQRSSPKEDTKTPALLPGRVLNPPNDKPRPAISKNAGEVTPKKNTVPNLDLSLNRQNQADDSNYFLAFGKILSSVVNTLRTVRYVWCLAECVWLFSNRAPPHPSHGDTDTRWHEEVPCLPNFIPPNCPPRETQPGSRAGDTRGAK